MSSRSRKRQRQHSSNHSKAATIDDGTSLNQCLNYDEGSRYFRQTIIYSILSGRSVNINGIRSYDDNPGVCDFELKFLELIDNITNGTEIVISETGTQVSFKPGIIHGGTFDFDCGTKRCISYFLEPLIMLSPFTKKPLNAKLFGVTNSPDEPSVDALRATWLPVLAKFVRNDEQKAQIKILHRGFFPDGGGQIIFTAPNCKQLQPIQADKLSKICKIRGLAYIAKVSPTIASRMIHSAKDTLHGFIADVYITVDQRKGVAGGKSPGYGLFLTAETTDGVVYHGEAMSKPKGCIDKQPSIPEDVGILAAQRLINEIYRGGCVDSSAQCLTATLMTLCEKDISKYVFGPLSDYCIHSLRQLRDFFNHQFKIDNWQMICDKEDVEMRLGDQNKALMTCIGIGFTNMNRTML